MMGRSTTTKAYRRTISFGLLALQGSGDNPGTDRREQSGEVSQGQLWAMLEIRWSEAVVR
jgi:hypothetical protein